MHKQFSHFCIEQHFSPEEMKTLRELARDENPINVEPFEAAALHSTFWQVGKTLRVKFLEGDPSIHRKVAFYAMQWSQYANITFAFVNDPDAEIRISFAEGGSWSAVGMEAKLTKKFPKNGPTMNFGWLTSDLSETDFASVVLHEFGHALGMIHEHQSPAGSIQWNRQVVIDELLGWPYYWNRQQIEDNIFKRFYSSETQFTSFDPHSIMIYAIPPHWTKNGLAFAQNSTLSQTDIHFIRACYPQ